MKIRGRRGRIRTLWHITSRKDFRPEQVPTYLEADAYRRGLIRRKPVPKLYASQAIAEMKMAPDEVRWARKKRADGRCCLWHYRRSGRSGWPGSHGTEWRKRRRWWGRRFWRGQHHHFRALCDHRPWRSAHRPRAQWCGWNARRGGRQRWTGTGRGRRWRRWRWRMRRRRRAHPHRHVELQRASDHGSRVRRVAWYGWRGAVGGAGGSADGVTGFAGGAGGDGADGYTGASGVVQIVSI